MLLDRSKSCIRPRELYLHCDRSGLNYGLIVPCHKRFEVECPECSKRWRKGRIKKAHDGILSMDHPKFLTLTLTKERDSVTVPYNTMDIETLEPRNKGWSPLEVRHDLWDMRRELFIRLRKLKFEIKSWLGVIELPNHVHIVMDCEKYIPQRLISKIWHNITGDSYIVDIRPVWDIGRTVHYISKYLGKTLGVNDLSLEEMRGFHVMQSWGIPALVTVKALCPICGQLHQAILITEDEYWHDAAHQAPE